VPSGDRSKEETTVIQAQAGFIDAVALSAPSGLALRYGDGNSGASLGCQRLSSARVPSGCWLNDATWHRPGIAFWSKVIFDTLSVVSLQLAKSSRSERLTVSP
jgi:hypothetical protein